MIFSIKHYYKPTPVKWRKIGDTMLGVSLFLTGSSLIANYRWFGILALLIGATGKFLSEWFSEDIN